MADEKYSEVVELLRRAESLLSPNPSTNNQQVTNATAGPSTSRPSTNPSGASEGGMALRANLRSLFAPYNSPMSSSRPPPAKRQRNQGGRSSWIHPRETWTHEFLCLADKDTSETPSRVEKFDLQENGLGRKRIVFNRDDGPVLFNNKVLESYPKLKDTGGYEFLRSGPVPKKLIVVAPPPRGYDVKFLRDEAGVGQAVLYIRPLQRSVGSETTGRQGQEMACQVQCVHCNVWKTYSEIKEHLESCGNQEQSEMSGGANTVTLAQLPSTCSGSGASESSDDHSDLPSISSSGSGASGPSVDQFEPPPSTSNVSRASVVLHEICPSASSSEIQVALSAAGGNVDEAAQTLLGIPEAVSIDSDDDLLESVYGADVPNSPAAALVHYRDKHCDSTKPSQLFRLSRLDGEKDLRREIFGLYKNPKTVLRATPRVRFDGEDAVGDGPVREFLTQAIKVAEEGFPSSGAGKPIAFFEGEPDHRIPVHDSALRLTGSFKAVGRIIGHSVLHGGPGLTGLSPAIKHYLSHAPDNQEPHPLTLEDIPDTDLRSLITELESLEAKEQPNGSLREAIKPYMFEAGLDPDILANNTHLVAEGLMLYNVIDRRRLQLEDIKSGMEEVSLHAFLKKCPAAISVVFPVESDRKITAKDVKKSLVFDGKEESEANEKAAVYFLAYIDEMDLREDDNVQMTDLLSFWSGAPVLALSDGDLQAKFDGGAHDLPLSETCFRTIILPTKHASYEKFKVNMDIALKFGSKGFSFS